MDYTGRMDSHTPSHFADRISDVPRSFIREILKVTLDESMISFAGGLPNRDLFPVDELRESTLRVLDIYGRDLFQYSSSEGYAPLRELISLRYKEKEGLDIPVEDILITNGSQQGLDLLGKIFLNDRDAVVIEEPGYLGAIQAFSIYRPTFCTVPVDDQGMDIEKLRSYMRSSNPKLLYTVPNFQNPSGISYSYENRKEIAAILEGTQTLFIEDNPYGELRYSGTPSPSVKTLLPDNTILLGSFSKTVVPGFRLGWIVSGSEIMEKLIIAKQASDLHTNQLVQHIVYQYLKDNEIDKHIARIKDAYGEQLNTMIKYMDSCFPAEVTRTNPKGGMFIWNTLPEGYSTRKLLDLAIEQKVLFVPGDPFYVNRHDTNTMRLNFSCSSNEIIREGIGRLGDVLKSFIV